jgi:hypothetical protein
MFKSLFIERMDLVYAAADVVISRWCFVCFRVVCGKPVIFPSPMLKIIKLKCEAIVDKKER